YWPDLARVVDWADGDGLPTVWSCLGAHAAVLRLNGVRRRALPAKLSGVFESRIAGDDPLIAGAPARLATPHSRQNGLAEADLAAAGYRILTRSPEAGVDAFARRSGKGVALFLQGHPEYDAGTLMREYCRDVGRFLRGERPRHPASPAHYLAASVERELSALAERSARRPSPELMPLYAAALSRAEPAQTWRPFALTLYRNWLGEAAALASGVEDVLAQPAAS
ncbi:MAG: homoserine O-acetyltransferase/O-succinyltransferase family protein, partial [Caulobacteraceae bacterium]